MMKDRYRIGEVEKLLGIPRSTIRFYIKKGILRVDKDKSNGYRYYSREDMREITHLAMGRSYLDLSLDDSHHRIHAASLDDFHKIFYSQEEKLTRRILKDKRSLEILSIYNRMLERIKKYLNKFEVIKTEDFHIFSEEYIFDLRTTVIEAGFTTGLFHIDGKTVTPVFKGFCSLVHDMDKYLVSSEDFSCRDETVAGTSYLYTVFKGGGDMSSPDILEEILVSAAALGYNIEGNCYLSYLLEVAKEETKEYFYEVYLPLSS